MDADITKAILLRRRSTRFDLWRNSNSSRDALCDDRGSWFQKIFNSPIYERSARIYARLYLKIASQTLKTRASKESRWLGKKKEKIRRGNILALFLSFWSQRFLWKESEFLPWRWVLSRNNPEIINSMEFDEQAFDRTSLRAWNMRQVQGR